jgi:hypothetical protein
MLMLVKVDAACRAIKVYGRANGRGWERYRELQLAGADQEAMLMR